MFNILQTQPIADALKKLLNSFNRRFPAVLDVIQKFERAGWQPVAFQAALDSVGGFKVTYDGKLSISHEPSDQTPAAIQELLENYLTLIDFREEVIETALPNVFSIEEAARYLDMSIRAVKHHVHVSGKLESTLWNGNLAFTREMLDKFKLKPRKSGRPRKETELN